jgi:hypothetical protein
LWGDELGLRLAAEQLRELRRLLLERLRERLRQRLLLLWWRLPHLRS